MIRFRVEGERPKIPPTPYTVTIMGDGRVVLEADKPYIDVVFSTHRFGFGETILLALPEYESWEEFVGVGPLPGLKSVARKFGMGSLNHATVTHLPLQHGLSPSADPIRVKMMADGETIGLPPTPFYLCAGRFDTGCNEVVEGPGFCRNCFRQPTEEFLRSHGEDPKPRPIAWHVPKVFRQTFGAGPEDNTAKMLKTCEFTRIRESGQLAQRDWYLVQPPPGWTKKLIKKAEDRIVWALNDKSGAPTFLVVIYSDFHGVLIPGDPSI